MDNEIKMFIAGEEVVSQNEFTINQEMLSASSTILNNCYPKSWEEDKDYVSRFYYPKDYSKFVLGKGNFEEGSEEYAKMEVSDTNIMQYETNIEKEWNSLNVYGKTEQETSERNKNLFYVLNGLTDQGITITKETNSEIVINGTTTTSTTISIPLYITQLFRQPYSISIYSTGTTNKNIFIDIETTNNLNDFEIGSNETITHTSNTETSSSTINNLLLTLNPNTTLTDYHLKIQIEQNSTATEYVVSELAKPNVDNPTDLVSVGYENLFNNNANPNVTLRASYTKIDTGFRVTHTSSSNFGMLLFVIGNIEDFRNKTLTLSFNDESDVFDSSGFVNCNESGSQRTSLANISGPSGNKKISYMVNGTYTYDKIGIRIYMGTSIPTGNSYDIKNIQITIGDTVLQYIPYNKYGIDVLNTGKNLAFSNWADDCVLRINNASRASIEEYEGKTCLLTTPNAGYPDYLNGYIFKIKFKENTRYTFQFDAKSTQNDRMFRVVYTDGTYDTISASTSWTKRVLITQENKTVSDFRRAYYSGTCYIDINTFQVTEGTNVSDYEQYKCNTQLYVLDNPLRSIGNTKDKLYVENNNLYVERNIAYIDSYDGETITTDYMSTTGGLTTGASVQYITDKYIEDLGQVNILNSYVGQNNVFFTTGIDTIEDITYYWKNYDLLFAGIVKNSGEISLNPRYPHYCSLQILDYKTFLSESDTLDFVISNKTIREAIGMVVNSVAGYGFIVGNIDISSADDKIGAYSTLNKTAYDVLQYLADISGARWRARYVDSSTMAIDFYDTDTLPQGADIEYNKEYWEQNNIVDLTFNYGTRDYRNKQIILSDEIYASIDYVETLLSNGYSTNFITQNNIGSILLILVNGVPATFASASEKELGVDAQFYYTPGKNVLESSSSYSAGTQIIIDYIPLVKGRQIVYNDSEILRIASQTDTTGVISRYETRNDILSSKELEQIAKTYIEYKGKAEVILTLTTQNKDLYDIGEVVYFDAPIEDLKQNYMVKTKKIEYVVIKEIVNLFYVYELTSSFNSEKSINYFDNQRNKSFGNIAEGESITRNIDITNVANIIWNNLTITEKTITPDGDNALNSVLNSPFIV